MDKEDGDIYITKYYSAIKQNEIMSSEATRMDLEIIILSEVGRKEKENINDITSMWDLKYGTNELIHKTETNAQT